MDRILITGVAGFIGSKVARRFLEEGYAVVGIDDLSNGYAKNIPSEVEFIEGDLSKAEIISQIPPDCKKILHLAGQSSGEISFDNPLSDLEKNTISTLNLISYGIRNRVERLVYGSSMAVYGDVDDAPIAEHTQPMPLSCYGVGKLASEGYLRVYSHQLPFVSMRMFNVYGPGQDLGNLRQGMVSIFLAQALVSGEIEVKGSVDRFRDFIYIEDVVEAWFRASTYDNAKNKIINIGTGIKTTVSELLANLCSLLPDTKYFVRGITPGDQNGIYADVHQLGRILDMHAFTGLEEGLIKFLDWAKNND
jgi:UDP-glucose 4-epimerase